MDIPARQEKLNEMVDQVKSNVKNEGLLNVVGTMGFSISWKTLK